MPSLSVGRTLVAIGIAFVVAACAGSGAGSARRSDAPNLRCLNDPVRGQASDSSRPLFFIFCAQSP